MDPYTGSYEGLKTWDCWLNLSTLLRSYYTIVFDDRKIRLYDTIEMYHIETLKSDWKMQHYVPGLPCWVVPLPWCCWTTWLMTCYRNAVTWWFIVKRASEQPSYLQAAGTKCNPHSYASYWACMQSQSRWGPSGYGHVIMQSTEWASTMLKNSPKLPSSCIPLHTACCYQEFSCYWAATVQPGRWMMEREQLLSAGIDLP